MKLTRLFCAQISLGEGLITAGAQLVELDLSDPRRRADGVRGFEGPAQELRLRFTLPELKLNNCGMGIGGGKVGAATPSPHPCVFRLPPCLVPCYVCIRLGMAAWHRQIWDGSPLLFSLQRTEASKAAAYGQWGEEMDL